MLLLLSPHCAACRVRACWFNLHNTPQPPWVPPRVKNIQLRYSPCMLSSANAAASLRDRLELLVVSSARSSSSASSKPWRRSSLMSGSSSLQLDAWNNETRLVFEVNQERMNIQLSYPVQHQTLLSLLYILVIGKYLELCCGCSRMSRRYDPRCSLPPRH